MAPPKPPSVLPSWEQLEHWQERRRGIRNPTRLVIMDEADRLRMASLEAAHAIFDQGGVSLILIGMPGMERCLAWYPQFHSRIGFAHPSRPLSADAVRSLLSSGWTPEGTAPVPLIGSSGQTCRPNNKLFWSKNPSCLISLSLPQDEDL